MSVVPIKKQIGREKGCASFGQSGKRLNTSAQVTFKRNLYYLPGGIELGLEGVTIHRDEIFELACVGIQWEQIENLYQVSQDNIKQHYSSIYNKGKATFEIAILKQMNEKALGGDTSMAVFMSKNRLRMAEKIEQVNSDAIPKPEEVRSKLDALLNKHLNKIKKDKGETE